jgi:hypothetical protein
MLNIIYKIFSNIYKNIYYYEFLFIIYNYFILKFFLDIYYFIILRILNYFLIKIIDNININNSLNILYKLYLIIYSVNNIYLYQHSNLYIKTLLNIIYYINWINLIVFIIFIYIIYKIEYIIENIMSNIDETTIIYVISDIIKLCCDVLNIRQDFELISEFEDYLIAINKKKKLKYLNQTYPIKIYQNENFDRCAICLEKYTKKNKYRIFECMHIFHSKCIDNWLCVHNNNNCPLCKKIIL